MTACELAHLRVSARRVFVPVGRRLVGEGDEGDDAFVVVAGVLHAYRKTKAFRTFSGRSSSKTAATETKAVPVPARVKVGEIGPGRVRRGARGSTFVGGRRRVVSVVATPPGAEAVAVSGRRCGGVAGETDAGESGGRPRRTEPSTWTMGYWGWFEAELGDWGWFVAALGDWLSSPRRSRRILAAARRVGGKGTKAVV